MNEVEVALRFDSPERFPHQLHPVVVVALEVERGFIAQDFASSGEQATRLARCKKRSSWNGERPQDRHRSDRPKDSCSKCESENPE